MSADLVIPAWPAMTEEQARRWDAVLGTLAEVLPDAAGVVVDSHRAQAAAVLADRLAATLHSRGRHAIRLTDTSPVPDEDAWFGDRTPVTIALADGGRWRATRRWETVIWLRTERAHAFPADHSEEGASIVIDLHNGAWPVIRHIDTALAPHHLWYRTESQAYFGVRAATWDAKFGDDIPAYAAAIQRSGIAFGGTAVDVGCGTGRALPALREAVGPMGAVLGIDHTRQMLEVARSSGRADSAHLLVADAQHLPLRDASVHAIFAAGLITHLPDIVAGLTELARVTAPGGRLILFHPSGRAALAARHGRTLDPDEPLAEHQLTRHLSAAGWRLADYDDAAGRFLALAQR
jgi:SAM-dependent methyltransferase